MPIAPRPRWPVLATTLACIALAHAHPGVPSDPATIVKVREKVAAVFPAASDTPIATGRDLSIPLADLRLAIVRSYLNRGIYFEGGPRDVATTPGELELRALLYLVNTHLLAARATPSDHARAQARFAEHTRTHDAATPAAAAHLAALGITKSDWDKHDLAQHLADLVLKREVEAAVTADDIARYYRDNASRFAFPESLHAFHLFFPVYDAATGQPFAGDARRQREERIATALRRAQAGDDFAALARESSASPSAASRNHEYVYQRGQMPAAFEATAFALRIGEVARIDTGDGTYLLKPIRRTPARKQELAEVRADIVEALGVLRMARHLEELQRGANLRIHDERLAALLASRLAAASLAPHVNAAAPD